MSGRDNRRWISLSARYSLCFWPGRFCREEKPCPTMFRSLMSLSLVRDIDILILPASLLVIIISRSIIGLVSGLFCGIRLLTFALSGFFSEPVSFFFEKMEFDWNTPQNISMAVSLQYKRTDLQTWIETILR